MKRNLIIIFFLIVALALFFTIRNVEKTASSWGVFTPIVLLLLIILATSFGIPSFVIVILAVILVHPVPAAIITVVGSTIGAAIAFMFARKLAPDSTRFIAHRKKLKELDSLLKEHGFVTILIIRQITPIPFELINIICGLSSMRLLDFVLGTLIGIIPSVALTIYFLQSFHSLWSPQFFISTTLVIVFTFVPLLSKRVRQIAFS